MRNLCTLILLLLTCVDPPLKEERLVVEVSCCPKTSASFLIAYSKLREAENNYVNDADDLGKETYAGITRLHNKNWYGWRYIHSNLKKYEYVPEAEFWVLDFYLTIWVREGFYNITNQQVADYLFDTRIHLYRNQTIKLLNNSYGLNIKQEEYWVTEELSNLDLNKLRIARLRYYDRLIKLKPKQIKYRKGWVKRAMRN